MSIYIINAKKDYDIFKKENIFEAYLNDQLVATGYLYPFLNEVLNPDHPFNVYMDVNCDDFKINADLLSQLFDVLLNTAKNIIQINGHHKSRIYHSSKLSESEKLDWFQEMGLQHDESTFLMVFDLSTNMQTQHTSVSNLNYKEIDRSDTEYIQVFLEGYHEAFSEEKTIDWFLDIMSKPNAKAITVFIDQTMVAGILVYQIDDQVGFIEALYVDSAYKGKKIGYNLLHHVHQEFLNQGLKMVQLEVWGPNKHARTFYEKFGYNYLRETAFSLGINITNISP